MTFNPSPLPFGIFAVGTTTAGSVTVIDSGTVDLTVASVAVSGANSGDFSVAADDCTGITIAGEYCELLLAFRPSGVGPRTATLSITDNASGSPQTIALSGYGLSPAPTQFVTYWGSYLSAGPALLGSPQTLLLRGYDPSGSGEITSLWFNLSNTSTAAVDYSAYLQIAGGTGNGLRTYSFKICPGGGSCQQYSSTFVASGQTVALTTPFTVGGLTVTAYTLTINGNELDFNPVFSRSDSTWNDNLVLYGTTSTSNGCNGGNACNQPDTVGTWTSAPTTFTAYLGPYGSGSQTFHGTSAVLPLRAYNPGGASQINYFWANLNATSGGAMEYEPVVKSDGAGGYQLLLKNASTSTYPYVELSASGSTVLLTTPITLGTMSITAYRFALAGNEMQLDLTVTRSGTFNDQIVIQAGTVAGAYSAPTVSDGAWSNP